jgi:hypothetical protein
MPGLYNMTQLQNADTFYTLIRFANDSTYTRGVNMLSGMFVIAVFFIMMMVLKKYDFDKSIPAASFVCSVLSLLMTAIGLGSWLFTIIFVIITFGSVLYLYIIRKD